MRISTLTMLSWSRYFEGERLGSESESETGDAVEGPRSGSGCGSFLSTALQQARDIAAMVDRELETDEVCFQHLQPCKKVNLGQIMMVFRVHVWSDSGALGICPVAQH